MMQKACVGIILLNFITFIDCSRKLTSFQHNAVFNGKACKSGKRVFEYIAASDKICNMLCDLNEKCVGVFYSQSTKTCTACGHFGDNSLADSVHDTKYFYNCAESVSWKHFGGSHYTVVNMNASFEDAKSFCRDNFCSHLVHFDNMEEVDFVNNMTIMANISTYFIGLVWNEADDTWRWVDDNTEATFTYWQPGEPNFFGEDAGCVAAWGPFNFTWVDLPCTGYPFVCEKEKNF